MNRNAMIDAKISRVVTVETPERNHHRLKVVFDKSSYELQSGACVYNTAQLR